MLYLRHSCLALMSHDTWIHCIARFVVSPLVDTPITPNQITTLRLISGLVSAGLFALGPVWHVYAVVLFIVSMLLDRADGELARISGKTSPWGHRYDLISDSVCNVLTFIGIGIGMTDSHLGPWSIPMGIAAGIAIAIIFWLVIAAEQASGQRAGELKSYAGFDADDGMILVPIAVLLSWTDILLIAASIGAPLFALFMAWYLRFVKKVI